MRDALVVWPCVISERSSPLAIYAYASIGRQRLIIKDVRSTMRDTASEHANSVPSFAGVDGCRAGWLVVLAHPLARDAQEHQVTLCARFEDVLALLPTSVVSAVDIPIGLLAEQQPGGRDCDRCA